MISEYIRNTEIDELSPSFPITYQKQNIGLVKKIVEGNDSILFLCMPGVGKERTARYLALNKKLGVHEFPNYDRYFYDCPILPQDFRKTLEKIIEKAEKRNRKALVVLDSVDKIIDNEEVLSTIQALTFEHEHLLNIISFTTAVKLFVSTKHLPKIIDYGFLQQNILYLGAMSYEDSLIFQNIWKKRFDAKFSKESGERIIELAGGNQTIQIILIRMLGLGVIKEEDLDNPELLIKRIPSIKFFLFKFMSRLGEELSSQLSTRTYQDSEELYSLGIVNKKGEFFSELFKIFLSKYWDESYIKSEFESDLTEQEQSVYKLLRLNPNGSVVTREDIAKALWGFQYAEKYSDWAIEKVIQNLRKKLKKENIDSLIMTKHGEGYYLKY